MATCKSCGGAIDFRYIDGRPTPIHLGGGRCSGVSGGGTVGPKASIARYESERFGKPARCPRCAADVFFVRHNGGSVWLDALGPPWPKHPCFDAGADGHRALDALLGPSRGRVLAGRLGLVVRCGVEVDGGTVYTLLAIECGGVRRCVSLRGEHAARLGSLVVVGPHGDGRPAETIGDADGNAWPVLNARLDPTLLGLPRDWSPPREAVSAKSSLIADPPNVPRHRWRNRRP